MKFYIATKLENHAEHNRVRDALTELGHEITYDWTEHGAVFGQGLGKLRQIAVLERLGVERADFVVVLWPGGRGTHVELGIALARNVPILMFTPLPEHREATRETCAFYHYPTVILFDTTDALIQYARANR